MGGLDLERQQGGPTPLKGLKIGTFWQFKHHQLSIIYLSIYLSVCLSVSVCLCLSLSVSVCLCLSLSVSVCLCRVYSYMCIIEYIYIYLYLCMCVLCIYIYLSLCVHMYIYIYTYLCKFCFRGIWWDLIEFNQQTCVALALYTSIAIYGGFLYMEVSYIWRLPKMGVAPNHPSP